MTVAKLKRHGGIVLSKVNMIGFMNVPGEAVDQGLRGERQGMKIASVNQFTFDGRGSRARDGLARAPEWKTIKPSC
jgi:hypothetical protein